MFAKTAISRRNMLGAALALGVCGAAGFLVKPAHAIADGNGISLLDDLEPYESRDFVDNIGSFTMAGDTYNGTTMPRYSYALYNLKGNYSELRFIVGHVDKSGRPGKTGHLAIYLDDVLFEQYDVSENDLPSMVQIPLSGVQVLKLASANSYVSDPSIGIANPMLFVDGTASDTIPDGDYESEVMDGDSPVTVKVTIADGLVSSLNIASDSESASLPALHKALGNIISTNSVEAAPAQESDALFTTE